MPSFDIDSRFGRAWAVPGAGMAQAFGVDDTFDSSAYFNTVSPMTLDAMGYNTATEFWNTPESSYPKLMVREIDDRAYGMSTTDAIAGMQSAWRSEAFPNLNAGGYGVSTGGLGDPEGAGAWNNEWKNVNRWNSNILAAAQKVWSETGSADPMPMGLAIALKAMVMMESGGNPDARASGASLVNGSWLEAGGLTQITNDSWYSNEIDFSRIFEPDYNLYYGAKELLARFNQLGDDYGRSGGFDDLDRWKRAEFSTYSGAPDRSPGDNTAYQTYWDNMSKTWDQLLGASKSGGTGALSITWGGGEATISQEFGMTDFAKGHPEWYDYSSDYTVDGQPMGHPGIDVSMEANTQLFSPVAGTIEIAGGSSFYCDDGDGGHGCGPGVGELRIRLDNGDVLILGHMRDIKVQVGQRIQAGSFMGLSGDSNGGHVHIEYRKVSDKTQRGFEVIDPRLAIGGYAGQATMLHTDIGPRGNMRERIRAAMAGEPLPDVSVGISDVSWWGDALRNAMAGGPPERSTA